MTERELRDLIAAVKAGELSRRVFVRRMIGLGLTAPFAAVNSYWRERDRGSLRGGPFQSFQPLRRLRASLPRRRPRFQPGP